MSRRGLAALAALAMAAGCAHRPDRAVAGSAPAPLVMEPMHFEARPDGRIEMIDAASLFARGADAFREGRFAESARLFDELVARFPASRQAPPALYNAGLSLEALGGEEALARAAASYRALVARGDEAVCGRVPCDDVLDALFRLGALLAGQKRWDEAARVYAEVLARPGLLLADRLEALARRGVALLEARDLAQAERTLREQVQLYRDRRRAPRPDEDPPLDRDFFAGMAAFHLGEIAREQYRALPIRLPSSGSERERERQLAADLDAKGRQLLVAQARYLDTIRLENAEWATAAGYRIAALYRELYDDLLAAPVPPQLDAERREVYLEELRKKIRNLLHKAIAVHERNVLMAERTGVQNDWARRSTEQLEELKRLLLPRAAGEPLPSPSAPPPPAEPLPVPKARGDFGRSPVL